MGICDIMNKGESGLWPYNVLPASAFYEFETPRVFTLSHRTSRLEVKNFRIIPAPDEQPDLQLTEAFQNFLDKTCGTLPEGIRYALIVSHPAFPFDGSNIFVKFRPHTAHEGEKIVNVLRSLIQRGKSLSFTDSFKLEIPTHDTTKS